MKPETRVIPPGNVPATLPPDYQQLWAVPLKAAKHAVAWKQPKPEEDLPSEKAEGMMEAMERVAAESLQREVTFLGPEYLSLYSTQTVISSGGGTGGSEIYDVFQIVDSSQIGARPPALYVRNAVLPISDDVRSKDLQACIDPNDKDQLRSEDFLTDAQETTYGIHRDQQKWAYHWVLGYSTGAARGYHTDCPVSILPSKTMVGSDQLFPEWKVVLAAFPKAQDAFSSPTHDLLLVFFEGGLQVVQIRDGKITNTLTQLQIEGKPVMVQWATGKYVEVWTRELQPYFENYNYVSPLERQQTKNLQEAEVHNARGIALMRQEKYEAAGGEFSEASLLVPGNAEYLNNLGYAAYKDEDYETAVRFLGEAMQADPKRAIAYLNRGDAFAKLQRYAEARKDYLEFLELAPDSKSAPGVKRKLDALPRTP